MVLSIVNSRIGCFELQEVAHMIKHCGFMSVQHCQVELK